MKLLIVAVGQRVPDWAQTAYDDYAKRFPPELKVELKAVKTEARASKTLENLLAAERARIEAVIPKCMRVVALDERGADWTTAKLASALGRWRDEGLHPAFVIGGPDGLDPELKASAHAQVRLSSLTLPHALARVLLAELAQGRELAPDQKKDDTQPTSTMMASTSTNPTPGYRT